MKSSNHWKTDGEKVPIIGTFAQGLRIICGSAGASPSRPDFRGEGELPGEPRGCIAHEWIMIQRPRLQPSDIP